MRDAEVVVERSLLPAPSAGEYYLADLVGAHVRAPDGDVGVVESIGIYPSADSLVIRTPSGERVEQPLEGGQVESIDIEAREVVLNSRQGLI
jgi:ribosomal 30S subunit maturation factor RimM